MSATGCNIDSDWLVSHQNAIACGTNPVTTIEAMNVYLGTEIELLECQCPWSFAQDTASDFCDITPEDRTLTAILADIRCGRLLDEPAVWIGMAKVALRRKECCETDPIYS